VTWTALGRDGSRTAVIDADGAHSYQQLSTASESAARALLAGKHDLDEARVGLFATPGFDFVSALFGIWRAGGIAVPLPLLHPPAELLHIVRDADVSAIVVSRDLLDAIQPTASAAGIELLATADLTGSSNTRLPDVAPERRALILYTSGTTGRSKGVVLTHANLDAQTSSLIEAWRWTEADRVLLVLPLHHVHGLVNVVCCAIRAGACCEMLPRFDPERTWSRLASGDVTVFTAVPTIYRRLLASFDAAAPDVRRGRSAGAAKPRLMMSGSAALPVSTLERWREITGHVLLERYGMTEIGMGLSNPIDGQRRPGFVGTPLPGVEVRIVDAAGAVLPAGEPGELEIRGLAVFLEYWRQPDATRAAFRDGWFRTGDLAVLEGGSYRLLGRLSTDIIKTGGDKVSAIEIEDALRTHPDVADCAVIGVADADWGERVCAAVELRPGAGERTVDVAGWLKNRLAPSKIPKEVKCVTALPRNAMGKVVKGELRALFSTE
jgi:malonyl-CoA/methylmalonyl-CoA synthetase